MTDQLKSELLTIAAQSDDGLLRPKAVVEFARSNPDSALHQKFEWDDEEAAEEFRVMQARQLIRHYVKFEPRVDKVVRGFVSVASDRINDGGYRSIANVLDNPVYRQQAVEQALNDLVAVGTRNEHLPELASVFAQVGRVVESYRNQRGTAAA